ncbi:hypothetical protein F3I62_19550 [Pseudomonas sp. R-28-1W-6]|nr:hypothetical protein [Pseudomonas sp. R-28-1W-6]
MTADGEFRDGVLCHAGVVPYLADNEPSKLLQWLSANGRELSIAKG